MFGTGWVLMVIGLAQSTQNVAPSSTAISLETDDEVRVLTSNDWSFEISNTPFSARLRVRQVDAGLLRLKAGSAVWEADYSQADGRIEFASQHLPFPIGHYQWLPDEQPLIVPGPQPWFGLHAIHSDIVYDPTTKMYSLFWTGELANQYPRRQIGLATSKNAKDWKLHPGNPVIAVDGGEGVSGIMAHMPSVVIAPDRTWHMYYACYQNNVGNRMCHATSEEGMQWVPHGVVLDFGSPGEFDDAGLRSPEVHITDDGTWYMFYYGTHWGEHWGPVGIATSTDGWHWSKQGPITKDEFRLQTGGVLETPYGVEHWWNCQDVFCHSLADPSNLFIWTDTEQPVLTKGWQLWNSSYIQAPTMWMGDDDIYHMWFNAADPDLQEVLTHARSVPLPGQWLEIQIEWNGHQLAIQAHPVQMETSQEKEIDFVTRKIGPRLICDVAEIETLSISSTTSAELAESQILFE